MFEQPIINYLEKVLAWVSMGISRAANNSTLLCYFLKPCFFSIILSYLCFRMSKNSLVESYSGVFEYIESVYLLLGRARRGFV